MKRLLSESTTPSTQRFRPVLHGSLPTHEARRRRRWFSAQTPYALVAFAIATAGCATTTVDPALPRRAEPPPSIATVSASEVAASSGDLDDHGADVTGPSETSPPPRPDASAVDRRPWLGIEMRKADNGVLLDAVYPESPADKAGLLAGDLLQRLGDDAIVEPVDVHAAMRKHKAGNVLPVSVLRQDRPRLLRLELGPRPTLPELLEQLHVGKPAPSISTLQTVQGSVVPSLEQLRGNVVVLEFWASWCMACRALTPELNRWHQNGEVLGLRVLGITLDPRDVAADAAAQFKMEFSVHIDENAEVTEAYHASALPTVFVVDRTGTVRDVMVGFDPQKLASLHRLLDELLKQP